MILNIFLKSLQELYQSFCWEPLDCNCTITYLCVLWLLLLFLCLLVEVPFTLTFWENEQTQKHHQGRAQRRRKGGRRKDWRYHKREEEEKKMLLSVLKSSLGQHHDSTCFRQLLCPDPSCEVCNDATAEMDQLLISETLQDAPPSVSSLASAAPVTESLFTLSPAFSAVPPGKLILPPLSEPLPPPLSNLSPNPVTLLGDFPSPTPLVHSLTSEPLPPLEPKFTVDDSPFQTLAFPSLPPHDTQSSGTFLTLNTIFIDASITQDINPFPGLGPTLNLTASVTYHVPPTMSVSPPPHNSLTVTRPKSIHISSKPALENPSTDSTGALATYVPQGTGHPKLSSSHFFCQEACVRDPFLSTLALGDFSQVQNVGCDSEKDLHTDIMSLSGENSMISEQNVRQRQPENASRAHLSKKSEEISEGQLPATVHRPWHAIHWALSGQYHNKIKQRRLALPAGEESCLNTCHELSFFECSERQKLEAHITKFHLRRMWALLAKVLKSIKIFKLRDISSHSLSDSKSSSSTNLISEDSKSSGFQPVRRISKTLNHPHPATSLLGKEGQGTISQPLLNIAHGLVEGVQRIQVAPQTLLRVTNSIIGKESERHTPRANICPPKLPIRQAGARHEPNDQRVNSSQSKKIKKSKPVSMPNVSRAEEIDALQSKMSDILTTSKLGTSQRVNVNESKGVTPGTTKSLPAKTSVLQDLKSADPQKQLLPELKWKTENRKQCQAQGQHTHVSHASDSMTYKASLTHAQGVSSGDGEAPQVLHVHLGNTGVSTEQPQEPWVPKDISRLYQDKNFPPAAKVRPIGPTSEELGGGNAELGTSQPGRKRFPTQDLPLKEMLGRKSPQNPSQKAQSPPESLFRNQMNRFFQWLHPEIKCKEEEYSQEKGSPLSSAQSRGPVKSRADTEEKLGHQHAVDITCPQEPLPSAVKIEKGHQKAVVCAQAEPVQGHPFKFRIPFFKVTNTKYYGQEAVFRGKDRHPQKVVAFKDQLLDQKQPQSVPWRGTVPRPSPTCRPAAARGPPALTTAGGVVEINVYYLDRDNLYRISRERIFPTPN